MKQKRLLLLLALLITAATGAWAQATHRITATITSPDKSHTGTIDVRLPYTVSIGDAYKAITGNDLPNDIRVVSLSGYGLDFSTFDTSNPWNTTITVTDEGDYTLTIEYNKEGIDGDLTATVNISMVPIYSVKLADGTADAGNWTATLGTNSNAQPLPVGGLSRGDAVTLNYSGRLKVKSVTATTNAWMGDLSNIPASALEADGNTLIVPDGATLKGRLNVSTIPYKVVIPDGATVTLAGLSLEGNHVNNEAYKHAGITCLGDATIILADDTENTVKGFYNTYPGIQAGPANTTLTIQGGTAGNGKLTASSNGQAAGIGAEYAHSCGDIEILGGDITAMGGKSSAGIGGGPSAPCGGITIIGGTVTAIGGQFGAGIGSGNGYGAICGFITIIGGTVKAIGGENSAGIGSGYGTNASCGDITIIGGTVEAIATYNGAGIGSGLNGTCGDITITDRVTSVTATKGTYAPYSIGEGTTNQDGISTCGTVTIGGTLDTEGNPVGGTVYWQDNAAVSTDAEAYLAQAAIVYPNPFASVTPDDIGKMIGADGKIYDTATVATAAGTTAVAMIVFVDLVEPGYADASSTIYRGLALALSDDGNGAKWGNINSDPCLTEYGAEVTEMNGIANTNTLLSHPLGHSHAAAKAARGHNGGKHPAGTSEWFLPSAGQWVMIKTVFGYANDGIHGYTPMSEGYPYWSSTEQDAGNAYCFNPYTAGLEQSLTPLLKSASDVHVRACIAF